MTNPTKRKRVLAVASAGGHWVQLLRLRPAWEDCDSAYVTTNPGYRDQVAPARFYTVKDANRWNKLRLIQQMLGIVWVLLRERPHVIISTGAAPGFFALRLGKLLGAKTCWIDSIANVEELSLSGQRIGPHADLWLTQWPHLAQESGPKHFGAVV
jgi:UDP-N-acetylglucosamine:LPS N-acetylglucosamine transferase